MRMMFQAPGFDLPVTGVADDPVTLGIRPEHLRLRLAPGNGAIRFQVDVVELVEPETLVFVKAGDRSLVVRHNDDTIDCAPGAEVFLEFPVPQRHFFAATDGRRIGDSP